MTAQEYLERIRTAKTNAEAYAVTREAIADANAKRLTVQEWDAVWAAYDRRVRPERYRIGGELFLQGGARGHSSWTGD